MPNSTFSPEVRDAAYWRDRSRGATPSMAQFFENKAAHPECLLFFRMGDFYELFFDDAVAAASALDIALTKRGKHAGEEIPMCGVPVVQAERYLHDLIRVGFRVAICEQTEDPAAARKRGAKIVRREVTRVVTPGTLTEDALLDARAGNYLLAYVEVGPEAAAAWVDASTGEMRAAPVDRAGLGALIARLGAREALIPDRLAEEDGLWEAIEAEGAAPTPLGPASFDPASGLKRLTDLHRVRDLSGFGAFTKAEIAALGALTDYLNVTQKGALPYLRPPAREAANTVMRLDPATRRNLELSESLSGGRKGSLLHAVDRAATAAGARLLAERLAAPLTNVAEINARLDAVEFLTSAHALRGDLRAALKQCPDMARALSRLSLERGGPRDLAAMRNGLTQAADIAALFTEQTDAPEQIRRAVAAVQNPELDILAQRLTAALTEDPPPRVSDGGFVAPDWSQDLDQTRSLRDDSRKIIRDLEAAARDDTGVSALKIKYNNVLGYFIEVPSAHAGKLKPETYRHRQGLANAARFTTAELAELDAKISRAGDQALALEKAVFDALGADVLAVRDAAAAASDALAALDVAAAAAELAALEEWTRPVVSTDRAFEIIGGRHPVVEQALKADGAAFVANDCDLTAADGAARLDLLTGPNMAGKSTYLRQNALIAILAQAGLFAPAKSARIGVADQVFSRVGAADDLARGRSTFMVEMVETAVILNQAGPGALVILDEIGRGTATFDGLSIAWATIEHLHDVNRCRGLFATHYHELTTLADRMGNVSCASVAVAEWEGEIRFLHEVRPGAADRSYGVQVARLAGLPAVVTDRAEQVLRALEAGDAAAGGGAKAKAMLDDLPLFAVAAAAAPEPQTELQTGPQTGLQTSANAAAPHPAADPRETAALAALAQMDPDALTPREALQKLYELKETLCANANANA